MVPKGAGSQPQGAEWQVPACGQGMRVQRPLSWGCVLGVLPEAGDIDEASGLCGYGGLGSGPQSKGSSHCPVQCVLPG